MCHVYSHFYSCLLGINGLTLLLLKTFSTLHFQLLKKYCSGAVFWISGCEGSCSERVELCRGPGRGGC